jgi:AcrR family transcriptional regulator
MASTAPTGKAATQERILAAATALFVEQGYDQTTVQEVATRAGVSRATVFWHFSEKAALFRESFSRLLQPFRESVERDPGSFEPAKRLEELMEMSERFAIDHRAEIAAFVRWAFELPAFRETVVTALIDLNRRFSGAITQAVAELAPPGLDPQRLATGIMLAFDGNLLLSFFDPAPQNVEERRAAVHELTRLVQRADGLQEPGDTAE